MDIHKYKFKGLQKYKKMFLALGVFVVMAIKNVSALDTSLAGVELALFLEERSYSFCIKAIILSILLVYSIVSIILCKRIENPINQFEEFKKKLGPILGWGYIIFLPFFALLLQPQIHEGVLIKILLAFYGVILSISTLLFFAWGKVKFFEWLGLRSKAKRPNYRRSNR